MVMIRTQSGFPKVNVQVCRTAMRAEKALGNGDEQRGLCKITADNEKLLTLGGHKAGLVGILTSHGNRE